MKRLTLIGLLLVLLAGCVSSQHLVKPGSSLNAYKYVVINPLRFDVYETQMELSSLFSQEGFVVLDEFTIKSLPEREMNKVLLCRYSYTVSVPAAIVHIQLDDYYMHKNVFTGKGEYGMGWGRRGDVVGAIRQAFSGIAKEYTGFSEGYVQYPEWEDIQKTKDDLVKYFDSNLHSLDPLEGIWTATDNSYTVGIFKDTLSNKRDFVATVMNTEKPLWKLGDVKMEFVASAYPNVYATTYFMADKSNQGTTSRISEGGLLTMTLRNPDNSPLQMSFIKNYPKDLESGYGTDVTPESRHFPVSGSGFLLSQSGLVVTNYHVISDSKKIEVSFPYENETYQTKVALKDINNDIVLLRVEDVNFSKQFSLTIPFGFANSSDANVGEDVFTIGYPLGEILGKSPKLSKGVINSLYGISDDPRLLQISNPVQPGNSGGPLFNSRGEIVGVVIATLNVKYFYEKLDIIPQNVNFAIKVDYLKNIVSMLPEGDEIIHRKSSLTNDSLEDQVKKIVPFIVTIKAY